MVWYSHLFKNFPQFIVIHTVKCFGIVNKTAVDVFLELSCFFNDSADVGNLISGSLFLKATLKQEEGQSHGVRWDPCSAVLSGIHGSIEGRILQVEVESIEFHGL